MRTRRCRPSATPVKCKLHISDGTFCWGGKPVWPLIYNVFSDEDVADVPKPSAPSTIETRILVLKVGQNPHVIAAAVKEALRDIQKINTCFHQRFSNTASR